SPTRSSPARTSGRKGSGSAKSRRGPVGTIYLGRYRPGVARALDLPEHALGARRASVRTLERDRKRYEIVAGVDIERERKWALDAVGQAAALGLLGVPTQRVRPELRLARPRGVDHERVRTGVVP